MIFFDMDGTLAKFYHDKDYLERMYEKGYFLALKPYKLINAVKKLYKQTNGNIAILSACVASPYCEDEKRAWLRQYLPEIDIEHQIFTKIGENKAEVAQTYAEQHSETQLILVDDYSRNIYEWEMAGNNFHAIKFLNGINNKNDREYRYKARTCKQVYKILEELGALEVEDFQMV